LRLESERLERRSEHTYRNHLVGAYAVTAKGPLSLHKAMAFSRPIAEGYVSLVPMTSPFSAFNTK